jgi:quercetin dioxygenase-like cupin family protein
VAAAWQARIASPIARWVLPVPGGPRNTTFSRAVTKSNVPRWAMVSQASGSPLLKPPQTGGELLKISVEMAPGGFLPRPHAHPRAEERFEVATGRIQLKTSGKSRIAEAGETVIVPRGAGHVWGNPFDDPATVMVTLRPALKMETFFETFFGLAQDGKFSKTTQLPSFLQTVMLIHEFRDDIGFPGIAGTATRGLAAVLAPLARARGYRSRYPQYSDADAP